MASLPIPINRTFRNAEANVVAAQREWLDDNDLAWTSHAPALTLGVFAEWCATLLAWAACIVAVGYALAV